MKIREVRPLKGFRKQLKRLTNQQRQQVFETLEALYQDPPVDGYGSTNCGASANGLDKHEVRHGIEDTRQAVLEARRMGLQPFCVTIDEKGNDYLPHLFGNAG